MEKDTVLETNILSARSGVTNLPDEILLKIFGYCYLRDMFSLRLVCKKWWELCLDSSLFTGLLLSKDMNVVPLISMMKTNSTFPARLRIRNRHDISSLSSTLLALFKNCDFSCREKYNRWFQSFYMCLEDCHCTKEKHRPCNCKREKSKFLINPLNANNKNTLKLKHCCNCIVSTVSAFLKQNTGGVQKSFFQSLRVVNISITRPITCPKACSCVKAKDLIQQCHKLISFKYKKNYCSKSVTCKITMESILTTISTRFENITIIKMTANWLQDQHSPILRSLSKKLKVLHLYSARNITANFIETFKLFSLRSFTVTENKYIAPNNWADLLNSPGMVGVRCLNFDDCLIDNEVMTAMGKNCKNLVKLSLDGCRNDGVIFTSVGLISLFSSCKTLTKLSLCFVDRELKSALKFAPENVRIRLIPINIEFVT